MKFIFFIVDVNNAPVEATIDLVANQPRTEIYKNNVTVGGKAIITLPDDVWTVAASIPSLEHNDDLVRLRKVEGSSEWQVDNPACHITGSGSELSATLIVGRLRPAPTVHVPDDQIPKIAGHPAGVLLFKNNEGLIYPLKGGFKAKFEENFEVVSQSIEVLPTDQVVPVEVKYDPMTGRQIRAE